MRQLLRERIFLELYRLLDFGGLHADKRALESGAFLILAGKWGFALDALNGWLNAEFLRKNANFKTFRIAGMMFPSN